MSDPELWREVNSFELRSDSNEESDSGSDSGSEPGLHDSFERLLELPECTGVLVQWKPGLVWDSYPYQQHIKKSLSWEPIGFESDNWLGLRSTKCKLVLKDDVLQTHTCHACQNIPNSTSFTKFMKRAIDAPSHTPWQYLNHKQIYGHLTKTTKDYRQLKLKVMKMNKKLLRAQKKTNDYQRIMMLLANNDVPGLRRLLTVALRKGAGVQSVTSVLEQAISGLYRPRGNWSEVQT
jgi:hypothetical protein